MKLLQTLSASVAIVILVADLSMGETMDDHERELRGALTFYASFDEAVRGDFGGGVLTPSTRHDDPERQGEFIFAEGIDDKVFRIAKDRGLCGGALEVVDVLPHRGRIFFPARGNLAYKPDGWGGAVSFWLNTNPNKLLKTPFCDPIQITHKGASDGGLWTDFPDAQPRNFRLGAFPALAEGEKAIPESDPDAPLVTVEDIGFKSGEWHHVVMCWRNVDSGEPNAATELYVDGKLRGALKPRVLAMRWDLDRTGIYFAVNYIGLMDELAVFDRPLTAAEVEFLRDHPATVTDRNE